MRLHSVVRLLVAVIFFCWSAAALAGVDVEIDRAAKVKGTILPEGEVEEFRFDATAGTKVSITVGAKKKADLDLEVTLTGPEGPVDLAAGKFKDAGKKVSAKGVVLTETGRYRLRVAAKGTGEYALSLKGAPQKKWKETLTIAGGGSEGFLFSAPAGSTLAIKAKAAKGSSAEPRLGTLGTADLEDEGRATTKSHAVKIEAPGAGDLALAVKNLGAVDGDVEVQVAVKAPKVKALKLDFRGLTFGTPNGGETVVSRTVTAEFGGAVEVVDAGSDIRGASVEIEGGGDIPADTRITMSSAPPLEVDDPAAEQPAGPAVSFGPSGLTSERPMRVTVPFDPARLPLGADPARDIRVLKQTEDGTREVLAPVPLGIDFANHTITVETRSFSTFMPIVPQGAPDLTDREYWVLGMELEMEPDPVEPPDSRQRELYVLLGSIAFGPPGAFEGDEVSGAAFGSSVAIDGDRMVVGAYRSPREGPDTGTAFVYRRAGGDWVLEAELVRGDEAAGDWFGVDVAIDGDTAIVGAYRDDTDGGAQAGSAYVYTRNGTTWAVQAKLTASDARANDRFGVSVDVHGDTAVVGAYLADRMGFDSGAAYVFTRDGDAWSEQAVLVGGETRTWDWLGRSVAIDGDTIVAGAYHTTVGGAVEAGDAYVFTRTADTWSEQARLQASDPQAKGQFGYAVDVSGDTAIFAARTADSFAGAAYVFTRSGTAWSQQARLAASDAAAGDVFGDTLALDGDTAVIGARRTTSDANKGAAYVFTRAQGTWSETKVTAPDGEAGDWFGTQAAVDGTGAFVLGTPGDDDAGSDAGAVWTFDSAAAVGVKVAPEPPPVTEDGGDFQISGEERAVSYDHPTVPGPGETMEVHGQRTFEQLGWSSNGTWGFAEDGRTLELYNTTEDETSSWAVSANGSVLVTGLDPEPLPLAYFDLAIEKLPAAPTTASLVGTWWYGDIEVFSDMPNPNAPLAMGHFRAVGTMTLKADGKASFDVTFRETFGSETFESERMKEKWSGTFRIDDAPGPFQGTVIVAVEEDDGTEEFRWLPGAGVMIGTDKDPIHDGGLVAVAIRQGAGMSDADLSGEYTTFGFEFDLRTYDVDVSAPGADPVLVTVPDWQLTSFREARVFDGAGGMTLGAYDDRSVWRDPGSDGGVRMDQETGETGTFTGGYSVKSNGEIVWNDGEDGLDLLGGLTPDGTFGFLIQDPDDDVGISFDLFVKPPPKRE